MNTRSKVIISAAILAAVTGVALVGTSFAEHRDARPGEGPRHEQRAQGEHQGHHGMHRGHGMREHGGGRHGMRMFKDFDSNGDGKLTQDEINTARDQRLTAFDSDNNGQLNLEEFQALWLDEMHSRMVDRFQALDEDGDASVTLEEFRDPFATVLEYMDRNGDGEVTRDELRPPRR